MTLHPVPAFADNYLWLLADGGDAIAIDPGDAPPVLGALAAHGLALRAILVTHHHADHVGGVAALRARFDVPVHGPRAESARIAGLTALVGDGDTVEALGRRFQVLGVPGHTAGHIAFHAPGVLFCGDTLFASGCGRLFEGTPSQMHDSLARLAALPADTAVCCAHEYTLANLAFARAVEPDNADLAARTREVEALRAREVPSLPSTIGLERRVNPFLRCEEPPVIAAAERHTGRALGAPVEVFAELRRWKDGFRAAT
jgi:hydroxyacylglutathione hydrolase